MSLPLDELAVQLPPSPPPSGRKRRRDGEISSPQYPLLPPSTNLTPEKKTRRRASAGPTTSPASDLPQHHHPTPPITPPTTTLRRRSVLPSPPSGAPSPTSSTTPSPLPTPTSPLDIDATITRLLRQPIHLPPKTTHTTGFVYVLPVLHTTTGKLLVKIGHTTQPTVDARKASICRAAVQFSPPNETHVDLEIKAYYRLVERLAHTELGAVRYVFECPCGKTHREYFEVGEAAAREVIRGWIGFCEREPWEVSGGGEGGGGGGRGKGRLKPFWRERLRVWRVAGVGASGSGNDGEGVYGLEERRRKWEEFANVRETVVGQWEKAWSFRWVALSVVLALWLWEPWVLVGVLFATIMEIVCRRIAGEGMSCSCAPQLWEVFARPWVRISPFQWAGCSVVLALWLWSPWLLAGVFSLTILEIAWPELQVGGCATWETLAMRWAGLLAIAVDKGGWGRMGELRLASARRVCGSDDDADDDSDETRDEDGSNDSESNGLELPGLPGALGGIPGGWLSTDSEDVDGDGWDSDLDQQYFDQNFKSKGLRAS